MKLNDALGPTVGGFEAGVAVYTRTRDLIRQAIEKATLGNFEIPTDKGEHLRRIQCFVGRIAFELFCLRITDQQGNHPTEICCLSCFRGNVQVAVSMCVGLLPADVNGFATCPYTWAECYSAGMMMMTDAACLDAVYRSLPHKVVSPTEERDIVRNSSSIEELRAGLGARHPFVQVAEAINDALGGALNNPAKPK